jgi:predicted RNase H-like HicB family nuclease
MLSLTAGCKMEACGRVFGGESHTEYVKVMLVRAEKMLYDLCRKQRCSMRQVLIYTGEDGYWVAECPSLPGCISQSKDRAEAVENIRETIRGYVAALEEDNMPVPEERFEAH